MTDEGGHSRFDISEASRMPGWEALPEEHFQGCDMRPASHGECALHRDFSGGDAVGPLSFLSYQGPLLPDTAFVT